MRLCREGTPATDVQFLLEGDVQLSGGDDAPRDVAAPIALAFEEVLEGAPLGCTARAVDRAVTLALDGSDFLTMLSDNVVLAQGLFRVLLDRPKMQPWRVVYAPQAGAVIPRGLSPQPIEIVLLLRQNPLLRRATVGQLLDLVAITREVELTAGRVLFAETDGPAVYHILTGEVMLEGDRTEERIVGPGCTIGLAETLAGVPLGRRSTVTQTGRALRIERDDLFDVLTDHVDLLQGLFSGVLSAGEPEAAVAERASYSRIWRHEVKVVRVNCEGDMRKRLCTVVLLAVSLWSWSAVVAQQTRCRAANRRSFRARRPSNFS